MKGWPTAGLVDKYGNEIEDRIYNLKTTIEHSNWLEKFTKWSLKKILLFKSNWSICQNYSVLQEILIMRIEIKHSLMKMQI
jgi:hypothetical protein